MDMEGNEPGRGRDSRRGFLRRSVPLLSGWLAARARLRLSLRVLLLVVGAALSAGLAVAAVGYVQASDELRRAAEDKLQALLQARTIAIRDYLSSIQRDLQSQATNPFIIDALSTFVVARNELGADANAALRELYLTGNPYPP